MQPPQEPPAMGRGALAAGIAQSLGRASGFLRDVIFASVFGAGATADAFFVAFRVPNLFRELLAEGTLSNVFVPLFAETNAKEGVERGWALANAMLGFLLVALGLVTMVIFFASEPLVLALASGFSAEPGKVELASWLTRLLAPFLAGISIAALFGGMLNVRGKFFLPALAPAVLNLAIIAACLGAEQWAALTSTPAIGAVAFAATLSGLITAGIQLPALRREGFRFRPTLKAHPALGRALKFAGAGLVGVIVVQFNLLVELQLASRAGDGAVSWLMLAFRFVQIPLSVIAGSIAVAAMARFSVQWAQDDTAGARLTLSEAIEGALLWVLPAAVGVHLLAEPLVALCFERGAFSAADTQATAQLVRGYAFAVIGICAHRVLLPIFFALRDPYLPMRLSLVVMAIKIPVALLLLDLFGLIGLPLSHAVTVSLEVIVMMAVLHRRLKGWQEGLWSELARIALASAVMGVAVHTLSTVLPAMGHLQVIVLSAAGGLVFISMALLLRIRALRPIWVKVQRRLAGPEVKQ